MRAATSNAAELRGVSEFPVGIAMVAALCGLAMSTIPYACWYAAAHSSFWIADADELLYALSASHAYYWHPFYLSDPTFAHGGQWIYSSLQIVPAELICRGLGLEPIRFGLVLRIFGGLAVGFGWYVVVWQFSRRSWVALLGAVFLMTDCGWLVNRPFVRQWWILASIALHRSADIFAGSPAIHREWRIVSPVAVLPFLLFYLWALRRSVDDASRTRVICSGFAFGLLFFSFFYYWTAAGLALIIGLAVDRERWRAYLSTGWIGALVGSPELARLLLTRNSQGSQWMQRFDVFLPIPRLSEHGHFYLSAALVAITFAIVRRYCRKLLYLWSLCASGLVMLHQQLFTGLQMQNYHWAYLFCACMTLLLALLAIEGLDRAGERRRILSAVVMAAVLLNAAAGVYLRGLEAVRTKDSQQFSRGYEAYSEQRDTAGNGPLESGEVTAGIRDYVEYAMIADHVLPLASAYPVMLSSLVTDSELDYRTALNSYLCGTSRAEFEAGQMEELDHLEYGPEWRDPEKRAARLASRMMLFDRVAADPAAGIEKFRVRYVAIPANVPKPVNLGAEWVLLQSGPAWEIWERRAEGG